MSLIFNLHAGVVLPRLPLHHSLLDKFLQLFSLTLLVKNVRSENMTNSIYQINKGINKPIEFKGLKAQYIWYLGGGLVALLVLFAIIYIIGVNVFICLAVIVSLSTALFMYVYKLSRTYGEFGLMKKVARKAVPKVIKSYSIVLLKKQLLK